MRTPTAPPEADLRFPVGSSEEEALAQGDLSARAPRSTKHGAAAWYHRTTMRHGRRDFLGWSLGALGGGAALWGCKAPAAFPPETTPEGAYARISVAISESRPRDVFAYLEDEAQWASHTIQKERRAALERARKSHPKEALDSLEAAYGPDAAAVDGVDVFVRVGKARGWFDRLRRDLSGVARTEIEGDRATLVTARGTRYPMRRRTVGLWGLTSFTAELVADAERATRDRARVEEAARDYDLAGLAGGGVTDAGPKKD
jgi:hypothetical protein